MLGGDNVADLRDLSKIRGKRMRMRQTGGARRAGVSSGRSRRGVLNLH